MKRFLTDNWITLVIGLAFTISAALALRNNAVIEQNHTIISQTDLVRKNTQAILTQTMHGLDLGVRGYGLTQDENLLIPYKEAVQTSAQIFHRIDSLLALQNYPKRNDAYKVMTEVKQYIELSNDMIAKAKAGDMEQFVALLKEDRGYQVWATYSKFSTELFQFEDELAAKSLSDYNNAIKGNLVLQISFLVLGLPMLFLFVRSVNKDRKRREKILEQVDHADRSYVFNDGVATNNLSEEINIRSVSHVRQASDFIASLASGDYEVQWKGMSEQNRSQNSATLAGNLFRLRERLKSVRLEDERRNMVNEGLASFSELVRTHQSDPDQLSMKCVSFLTKYLKAQQGSLFVLEENAGERYLKLAGCFAFERRKFLDKRIEIGNGLVGQTFLEGEPVMMKQVPSGYTSITSGLGDATPSCIAIIPVKHDTNTVAVMEFATFEEFEPHQIGFLQKAGEFFASAIINTRTTLKMKALLDEATEREAMMREREEELKQNMEELQATQEQLTRNQTSLYVTR
jgi:CHASE3 domain sensor protein